MPERRFAPGSTALYAVLWLAVVINGWSPLLTQDAMTWLRSPEDSAARKTSRDLELAEAICGPGWATPERFRLGASSVLGDLLAVAGGKARAGGAAGY